jgi:hypothetical protein
MPVSREWNERCIHSRSMESTPPLGVKADAVHIATLADHPYETAHTPLTVQYLHALRRSPDVVASLESAARFCDSNQVSPPGKTTSAVCSRTGCIGESHSMQVAGPGYPHG